MNTSLRICSRPKVAPSKQPTTGTSKSRPRQFAEISLSPLRQLSPGQYGELTAKPGQVQSRRASDAGTGATHQGMSAREEKIELHGASSESRYPVAFLPGKVLPQRKS